MITPSWMKTATETLLVERKALKMGRRKRRQQMLNGLEDEFNGLLSTESCFQQSPKMMANVDLATLTLAINEKRKNKTSLSQILVKHFPPLNKKKASELLERCRDRGLYDCMILVALQYDMLHSLMRFETLHSIPSVMCHMFQGDLLVDLAREGLWPSWFSLVAGISWDESFALGRWMAHTSVNSEALKVFEMLLLYFTGCHHPDIVYIRIKEIANIVVHCGHSVQYERLLFGSSDAVQCLRLNRDGRSVLEVLLSSNLSQRLNSPLRFNNSLNDCLVLSYKAGLFTLSDPDDRPRRRNNRLDEPSDEFSPMRDAVESNQPDVVKFLYSTGTVSDREVRQLSQDPDLLRKCARDVTTTTTTEHPPSPSTADSDRFPSTDDVPAAREIQSFLAVKASGPRSLESLCLTFVSKRLGLGNARKAAVREMNIAPTLKASLLNNGDRRLLKYRKK